MALGFEFTEISCFYLQFRYPVCLQLLGWGSAGRIPYVSRP
jgi:hypothetical protein